MRIERHVILVGLMVLITGCATKLAPQSDDQFQASITKAQQAFEQKGADQAVEQFEAIARQNPSRGEPWSYIAKIRFDEQRYGEAIVAADETLNRDPKDFVAKSVRAVGGLRVAMQSLADLRADALLAGNARPDAVALAAAMRETLGEEVLFPEGRKPQRRAPVRRATPPKPDVRPAAGLPGIDSPAAAPAAVSAPASAPSPAPTPAPAAAPAQPAAQTPQAPSQQPAGRAPNPFGNLLK